MLIYYWSHLKTNLPHLCHNLKKNKNLYLHWPKNLPYSFDFRRFLKSFPIYFLLTQLIDVFYMVCMFNLLTHQTSVNTNWPASVFILLSNISTMCFLYYNFIFFMKTMYSSYFSLILRSEYTFWSVRMCQSKV